MKALKAIKGFEMIISIQLDLLQEQLSVSVIEVKTSLTELKVYFCAFHMWGNHTLPAIDFGLDVFSKSLSLCKNVISYFCESAVREWQYQRKFNFNISCFGAGKLWFKAAFSENQLWQQFKETMKENGFIRFFDVIFVFLILYLLCWNARNVCWHVCSTYKAVALVPVPVQ